MRIEEAYEAPATAGSEPFAMEDSRDARQGTAGSGELELSRTVFSPERCEPMVPIAHNGIKNRCKVTLTATLRPALPLALPVV